MGAWRGLQSTRAQHRGAPQAASCLWPSNPGARWRLRTAAMYELLPTWLPNRQTSLRALRVLRRAPQRAREKPGSTKSTVFPRACRPGDQATRHSACPVFSARVSRRLALRTQPAPLRRTRGPMSAQSMRVDTPPHQMTTSEPSSAHYFSVASPTMPVAAAQLRPVPFNPHPSSATRVRISSAVRRIPAMRADSYVPPASAAAATSGALVVSSKRTLE